jgi:AcrR family transcriptional regulator
MTKRGRSGPGRGRRLSHHQVGDHRAQRRDQLLDTATEVVRRLGANTTMEAVAAEVGVAKPVLYRYFGNRSGLFDALAARVAVTLEKALSQALASGLPPRQRMEAAIDAYVGVLESDPEVYRFVTTRMRSEASAPGGAFDETTTMLARALGEALRRAGRDSGPAEVWAAGITGMIHVAAERWLLHPVMTRAALVEHLSDLLWSGLGAVTAPAVPSARSLAVAPRPGDARHGDAPGAAEAVR